MSFSERFKAGWNAFMGREPPGQSYGYATSIRPDSPRLTTTGADRTIVSAIYNRIAMDVAAVDIQHVFVDKNGNYKSKKDKSHLGEALTVEANLDQTGREFIQDLVLSMFDEGVVAAVPVDTSANPRTGAFDVYTMRTGKIVQWYPQFVRVSVYNEKTGQREEITLHKRSVAIITNPLYVVMNQHNSTLQRLIRKLAILDAIDEQNGSGKLNLIIQLPYVIKSESRREQAEKRKQDIEDQLVNSPHGIAYTDGTERITQLNRPIENNLLSQIEFLQDLLYSQLGLSKAIFDGTADEKMMLNYNNRTIAPILTAITEEMNRKFLTATARSQGQRLKFIRDPFKLVPVSQIAEIADKFTRSEILSSNELRSIVGFTPVDDPKADELRNSNLNQSADAPPPASTNPDARQYQQQEQPQAPAEAEGTESPPEEEVDILSLPISALDKFLKSK